MMPNYLNRAAASPRVLMLTSVLAALGMLLVCGAMLLDLRRDALEPPCEHGELLAERRRRRGLPVRVRQHRRLARLVRELDEPIERFTWKRTAISDSHIFPLFHRLHSRRFHRL